MFKHTFDLNAVNALINPNINLKKIHLDEGTPRIGQLECQLANLNASNHAYIAPITHYVASLNKVRQLSNQSKNFQDEINVAKTLAYELKRLSTEFKLDNDHFSIDTTGEPLAVTEKQGEHIILPTHFEKGAYFSHPHADHQLELGASDLPKIQIGQYVRFGKGIGINAGGNLTIGNAVWFSPGSYILKQNHDPYGRPSIASRTVAMTKLPSIKIEDFAWIGKEAVVGWNADYIGKASIIATRSFINSWVSDYSITGQHGKIIQYLPYKAAALELMGFNLDKILRITNWEQVNEVWLAHYSQFKREYQCKEPLPTIKNALAESQCKNARLLDLNPKYGDNLLYAARLGFHADGVDEHREKFPFILQRIQDLNSKLIRLRKLNNPRHLPFANASHDRLRNQNIGYDYVIYTEFDRPLTTQHIYTKLSEATRVSKIGAQIIFAMRDEYDYAELINASKQLRISYLNQTIEQNIQGERQHVIRFVKT